MGGEDITDSVYADGVITIPSVTSSVAITATAIPAPSEVGIYQFTNIVAMKMDENGELTASTQQKTADELIPVCDGAIAAISSGSVVALSDVSEYDADKNFLGKRTTPAYTTNENTKYVKVAFSASSGADSLVRMPFVQSAYFVEENTTLNSSGEFVNESGQYATDYQELTGAEGIVCMGCVSATSKIAYYDDSKAFISRQHGTKETTFTLTIPENAKYYRVCGTLDTYSNLPISGVS